jgi:GR25 family glycosyltransferase involved in LPS biosynthesis
MKHFWINIDKNIERQQFMTEQFDKFELENYRISACTPTHFDEILVQSRPLTCKYPGCVTCEFEFGCLCSHIKAMIKALETDDEWFAILEDDVFMPFKIDYDVLIQDFPKDAEIVQMLILYGDSVQKLYDYHKYTGQRYIPWQYLLPSTGFYIVSRAGAQKLVDKFYNKNTKKYDFSSTPFQIVADVVLYKTVNTYATTHPYAYPNIKMGSEIHSDHLIAQEKAIKDIKGIVRNHFKTGFPFVIYSVRENEL